MTTVNDLCAGALLDSGVLGVGQVAQPEDSNTAFRILNWMVAQWNRKRWLVYQLTNIMIASTGAESYTVGPGGDFNTPRPDRLEDGNYLRQLNTNTGNAVDYRMQLIGSYEDYNRIRLKSMGTWPSVVFYDPGWPLGTVYWWPVPQAATYGLNILVKNQISQFTGLSQVINLPPENEPALAYNLQVRLRVAYRMPPDAAMIALAKDALNVMRGANIAVPTMKMPPSVIGAQRAYNVFSDGY